jgi:hypothetical protein
MLQAFKLPPCVMFTDSDPAMALALRERLPSTLHLLCIWHLSKNLATNMKGTAGTKWPQFLKLWWNICKETDSRSRLAFDTEWDALIAALPQTPVDNEHAAARRVTALKWLEGMKSRKEQWAARWTWQHTTAGVHSTQRTESVHSAIKKFLNASTLLVRLAQDLVSYCGDIDGKASYLAAKAVLTWQASSETASYLIEPLEKIISTHAMNVIRGQDSQTKAYRIELLPSTDAAASPAAGGIKIYKVWRPKGISPCILLSGCLSMRLQSFICITLDLH